MSTYMPPVAPGEVDYPETDGLPMAENTVQARWIVTIHGGLDALFRDDPDVFVAMDLFWYPVEGDNKIVLAPDAMVALGRPQGDRPSYRQWEEGGIAPQVVFEVLSPSNDAREMRAKREFYERYGVEEYYEFDPNPEPVTLRGWSRQGDSFEEIRPIAGWTSPRLGIRFELTDDLTIYRPDGRPFETFREIARRAEEESLRAEEERRRADEERRHAEEERLRADQERRHAEEERRHAEEERLHAEEERLRADEERRHADQERLRADEERLRAEEAERRATEERLRAEGERLRAEGLAAKLRALGIDPDA